MQSCTQWHIYGIVLILTLCRAHGAMTSGFTNPLNNKRLDVFFVIDETNTYMSSSQLEWMKKSIYEISLNLNPSGSSPYFGVYFYGASSSVDLRVPFPTTSAASLKSPVNSKAYVIGQTNPSTLSSALNFVSSYCGSFCRSDTPRVTLIFSSNPDRSANSTIRLLERNYGMTVMIISIGITSTNNLLNANQLASYPQNRYLIGVSDFMYLTLFNDHISSIVADIPRLLFNRNSLSISYMSSYTYYTFQVNTASYTLYDEAIVILSSSCSGCSVFVSLTEQLPISGRAFASNIHPYYPATGSISYVSYLRVPRGAARVFVSYYSSSSLNNVVIISDVIASPTPLFMPITRAEINDLQSVIG